ncbi:MAG: diaminopimelate epimerase, partial [Verrucomicrobiota bacterium]
CFARFASRVAGPLQSLSFETPAGVIGARLHGESVSLQMSEPEDLRLNLEILFESEDIRAHFINSGVPHVVMPVSNLEVIDVRGLGARIRRHEMFAPKGANANFIEKRGPVEIAIRTYERGVEDETLACGTGVVASALIFAATENVDGPISVQVRGGDKLEVSFARRNREFTNVILTGPADFVFDGTIEL